MHTNHTDLSTAIPFRLHVSEIDLVLEAELTLAYTTRDPFAVTLLFPPVEPEEPPTSWVFARELLASGRHERVGEGDVEVRPTADRHVLVSLATEEGHARVEVASAALEAFLSGTYSLLPAGEEPGALDLDALVEALLTEC
ncbi:SsgA family sporulation/cell division regulator [Streptomyces sp. NPDC050504]|uniref:SsgA family sporulation/cell division regulator n=1 Tax=Streptomyces sp. NPDC050504 TaxID=3365618 RepID=UPI0037BB5249